MSNDQNEFARKVNALAEEWFGGEHTMFDACTEEPELAWRAILKILNWTHKRPGVFVSCRTAGDLALLAWGDVHR